MGLRIQSLGLRVEGLGFEALGGEGGVGVVGGGAREGVGLVERLIAEELFSCSVKTETQLQLQRETEILPRRASSNVWLPKLSSTGLWFLV